MRKNRLIFLLSLFLPVFLGAACVFPGINRKPGDGGVWMSDDRGATWRQKVFVRQEKRKVVDISKVNVNFLRFHTMDSRMIYAGTDKGIYFTENGGEQWNKIFDGIANDLSVVHSKRGSLYVAVGNSIYFTDDNGENWKQVYLDSRAVSVTQVLVDYKNENIIYAGTSKGDLIRSEDSGLSWNVLRQFQRSAVSKILLNVKDTSQIYVGTSRDGIWVSYDGGENWNSLKESYSKYRGSEQFKDMAMDEYEGVLYFASGYGLLKSTDGGSSWIPLDLLAQPGSANITALAVNPNNGDEVFYTSSAVVYRSYDGGINWITSRVPTKRVISDIIVDFYNPNRVFLGVKAVKKRRGPFL